MDSTNIVHCRFDVLSPGNSRIFIFMAFVNIGVFTKLLLVQV